MSHNARECRYCHLKFSEFEATGLLGCPACYDEFQEDIERILALRPGHAVHTGKRFAGKIDAAAGNTDVKQLNKELADAVKREAFELAARIRDTIRKHSETGSCPQ
jgi:protein arginine kinase activator